MKFIYAIIPFVNLATKDIVGGAPHALNKIVIATPFQGTCHDNFGGAPTKRVTTVDNGEPHNWRLKEENPHQSDVYTDLREIEDTNNN